MLSGSAFSVQSGGNSLLALEYQPEIIGRGKAAFLGDLGDALFALQQQLLGFGQAHLGQIFQRGA